MSTLACRQQLSPRATCPESRLFVQVPTSECRRPTRNLEWRLGFLSALPFDPELNLYFRFDVRLELGVVIGGIVNRHHPLPKALSSRLFIRTISNGQTEIELGCAYLSEKVLRQEFSG
jgi:hypothetical protein